MPRDQDLQGVSPIDPMYHDKAVLSKQLSVKFPARTAGLNTHKATKRRKRAWVVQSGFIQEEPISEG